MTEDTIFINTNAAYHVCRNNVQYQYENLSKNRNKESVPIEVDSEVMQHKATNQHRSMDACNHQSFSELTVDNLKAAKTNMKATLVCTMLLVTVLVVITLTAVVLSVLSYKLSQTYSESQTRLTALNGTQCNAIPEDIRLELDEHIQKELASLQTQLYCGAGKWHRITFLNMTSPSQQCPSAWREYNTSGARACGRAPSTEGSCSSVTYTAESRVYSRVCGQVIGYQVGSPDAFARAFNPNNIDMDGVNITLPGVQRYHIWSVVGGLTENSSRQGQTQNCPCSFTSGQGSPSYIGDKYYCESGNPTDDYEDNQIFSNDPVWDGKQCEGTCCSGTNYPPWFSVQLPVPTTDVIEVSICADESTDNEDTPIELLEIYVQ